MECPHCQADLRPGAQRCSACGADLTPLQGLREVRAELARTRRLLEERLARLDERLAAAEDRCRAAAPASSEAPAAEPEAEAHAQRAEPSATPAAPAAATATPAAASTPTPASGPGAARPETPDASAGTPAAPPRPAGLGELHVGQKGLLLVGIAITIIGVGTFLKFSFDRDWIGPAGQVALAYGAGVAALLGGWWFRRREELRGFGLPIMGGGLAVLYFAGFAAWQLYEPPVLGQGICFALMVAVTLLAGVLAVRQDSMWLAILGLVGGVGTPAVLEAGLRQPLALFGYLAVLGLGALGIAAWRQWDPLNYLACLGTWGLYAAWVGAEYRGTDLAFALATAQVFFVIYALAPYLYHLRRDGARAIAGFLLAMLNSFIAFGFSFGLIVDQHGAPPAALVALGYAVFFFALAGLFRYRRPRGPAAPFVLLVATALLYLGLAAPLYLSGHWITVFWVLQGLVVLGAALRLRSAALGYLGQCIRGLGVAKFLLYDYWAVFDFRLPAGRFLTGAEGGPVERVVTTVVAVGGVLASALLLHRWRGRLQAWALRGPGLCVASFLGLLFLVLNAEVASWFHYHAPAARFAALSVLWGLYAVGMMVFGFAAGARAVRIMALLLFGATVLKVFLVDMANVETAYRILSFVVLGLLLIGASYLYHRFRHRIVAAMEGAGEGEPAGEQA